MALASGLGGLPFFFTKNLSQRSEGVANAVASGVMLVVSFDILNDQFCVNRHALYAAGGPAMVAVQAVAGVIIGSWFIWASQGTENTRR